MSAPSAGEDAGPPLSPAPPAPETPRPGPIDRAISPIAGRLRSGRAGKAVVVAALVTGCGVFLAATWGADRAPPVRGADQPARQVVRYEGADTPPATLAAPGDNPPTLTPGEPQAPLPALAAEAPGSRPPPSPAPAAAAPSPLVAFRRAGRPAPAAAAAALGPAARPAAGDHDLDRLRQASTLDTAHAHRLGDRNYLILAGSALPCVLQTAIDTATPGYVSCLLPRAAMSDNGAVVLMEKGTRVLGEYRQGLRQGQKRLFVLWTRAVTPSGVAIELASPAADALGRTGFDGDIDSHFWDRFGGALLLSVVDGGAGVLGTNGAIARLPSDAAGLALQGSVGIPPSLRKAQGGEVSILITRDLDFSGVYGLKAR